MSLQSSGCTNVLRYVMSESLHIFPYFNVTTLIHTMVLFMLCPVPMFSYLPKPPSFSANIFCYVLSESPTLPSYPPLQSSSSPDILFMYCPKAFKISYVLLSLSVFTCIPRIHLAFHISASSISEQIFFTLRTLWSSYDVLDCSFVRPCRTLAIILITLCCLVWNSEDIYVALVFSLSSFVNPSILYLAHCLEYPRLAPSFYDALSLH